MKTFVCLALAVWVPLAFAQETKDAKEPAPTPGISVIKFIAPAYPPIARTARIQGDVRLLVEIAPDGSAKRVSVLSGHPMLQGAAMDAVKQWRFGCQRCDQPLRHIVTISFVVSENLTGDSTAVEPQLPNRVIINTGTTGIICDLRQVLTKTVTGMQIIELPIAVKRSDRPHVSVRH